jgi:hypothetical protein
MRQLRLDHEFVDHIPEQLREGILYVSMEYATAVHKCACGCGREVVTPFSPTDWNLRFDGDTVSLDPSIGNWAFKCRSHYWIENNVVSWTVGMSQQAIERGRARDRDAKARYYRFPQLTSEPDRQPKPGASAPVASTSNDKVGLWSSLKRWWTK